MLSQAPTIAFDVSGQVLLWLQLVLRGSHPVSGGGRGLLALLAWNLHILMPPFLHPLCFAAHSPGLDVIRTVVSQSGITPDAVFSNRVLRLWEGGLTAV